MTLSRAVSEGPEEAAAPTGRERQKGRTRKALLAAAIELLATGQTPSITEVADAAEISRRTAYRYFPTQEQLLVEAALEGLRPSIVDAVETPASGQPDDAETRLDRTVLALQRGAIANEQLLRTMIRLTVSRPPPTDQTHPAEPRRGYRRIEWIELALAPVRKQLGKKRFERLVSALTVCLGIDALIVLRDLRGLSDAEAEAVSLWSARALLRASIAEKAGERDYPAAAATAIRAGSNAPGRRR
jgi:AcrR family transcriptional regulator